MLDVDHLPNGATVNQLPDLLHPGRVSKDMTDSQVDIVLLTHSDNLPTVLLCGLGAENSLTFILSEEFTFYCMLALLMNNTCPDPV